MTDQQVVSLKSEDAASLLKKSIDQGESISETESGEDLEGSSHDEEEWDLMLHATLSSVLDDGSIPVSIIQSSIKAMSNSTSVPASFSEDYNDTFALDCDDDEGVEVPATHMSDYSTCNCEACLGMTPYDYIDPHVDNYYVPSGWSHHRTPKSYNHQTGYMGGGGYYKKPYGKHNNGQNYKHYVGNNYRRPRGYNYSAARHYPSYGY